ncbi:hypothetical protein [Rhodopseudomonas palustris]|uniref:hypothetical protein n=1 Tax=Rhodopseudomonas palustris TaxID=1076 RepID=UPI0011B03DCA|nr:hypothetical protein [Rhodopseudomonas palustris]
MKREEIDYSGVVIHEQVRLTALGWLSLLLLLGTFAIGSLGVLGLRETSIGFLLVAGVLLFGLGVALGRRRTYRVVQAAD